MTRLVRVWSGAMTLLLLYAVAVQYNDPDPVRWMLIYGACALVSAIVAINGRIRWWVAAIPAAIALAWSAYWSLGVIGQQPLWEEEGREMIGLLIAGGWTALLSAKSRIPG